MLSLSASQSGSRWDARLWGALIVLCGVLFLDGLDVSMVGVALPSIRDHLGLDPSSLRGTVPGPVPGPRGARLRAGRSLHAPRPRPVRLRPPGGVLSASAL